MIMAIAEFSQPSHEGLPIPSAVEHVRLTRNDATGSPTGRVATPSSWLAGLRLSRWLWLVKSLLAIPHSSCFPLAGLRGADWSGSLRFSLPAGTREGSSTSTSECCAGRGGWPSTRTVPLAPTAIRRSRSTRYPATRRHRPRLPGKALTRARAREVVAARDPPVHRRRRLCRRWVRGRASEPPVLGRARGGPHRRARLLRCGRASVHGALSARHFRLRPRPRPLGRARRRLCEYHSDAYPPFRLDQGGEDLAAAPWEAGPSPPAETQAVISATPAPAREGGGVGRVILLVLGSVVAAVLAFVLLAGGSALIVIDQTRAQQRRLPHVAVRGLCGRRHTRSSPRAQTLTPTGRNGRSTPSSGRCASAVRATVRSSSGSAPRPRSTRISRRHRPRRRRRTWRTSRATPACQGASPRGHRPTRSSGSHRPRGRVNRLLAWVAEDGDWRIVVMNADARRGVSSEMGIGAELDSSDLDQGSASLLGAHSLGAAAALAITAGVRRGRQ